VLHETIHEMHRTKQNDIIFKIDFEKTMTKSAGVIPHLVDDDLSILQYADDMILFMEHNFEQVKNLNLV
jgi:hypothetical protein